MSKSNVEYATEFLLDLSEKTPVRVLHVDDEFSLLKVAKQCLEMEGNLQVDTAVSADEAEKKMNEKVYDVIVSDYMMPKRTGLDFLKDLRKSGNNIPFIVFTGKGREEVAVKALNLGADQYLNKVGDPETVYLELAYGIRKAADRERATRRIRESEEKFRNIFESANDVMIYLDKAGKILDVNRKAVEMSGRAKGELVGSNFTELGLLSPKEMPKLIKSLSKGLTGRQPLLDIHLKDAKGQTVILECQGSQAKTTSETTLLVVARDVTKRKQAEEEVKRSEKKYKALVEETPVGICNLDIKGRITYANKAFAEITGYSREEFLGKSAFKLANEAIQVDEKKMKPIIIQMKNRLIGRTKSHPIMIPLRRRDGTLRWVEAESKLIRKLGLPVGLQAILRDVTERRQAEERTRESEELFRSMVENSHNGIGIIDDNFKVKYVNEQAASILGYSKEELVGQEFSKLLPENSRDMLLDRYLRRQRGEKVPTQYEFKMLQKDGTVITVELKAATTRDRHGRIQTVAEILDITGRKNAEREVFESQQKFHQLFMGNPEAAVYVDPNFHVLEVNPRFIELFGYSSEEVVNTHINALIVPKTKSQEAESLDKNSKRGYVYHNSVRKKKNGDLVPVAISAAPIIVGKKLTGHVALYKDISKLKEAEKVQRGTLEKLRVVGGLTRHDVRNKLSVIAGNIYLAKRKLPREHETMEHLADVESTIDQIEEILDFAGNYEKLGVEELTSIDVEKCIKEALSLFEDLNGVQIRCNCQVTVVADSLLRQLFYNLIDNSLKHGEKVDKIEIYSEKAKDGEVRLVYEDNGVGIPSEDKKVIFQEGYGKGTGYGLHLIRKMCEVYGWSILETGTWGKGAKFVITIPSRK